MSIRCDTASLVGSGIVCGGPGLGVLGSVLLATTGGVAGGAPGILYNDVQPGDADKEFRIQIQKPPASPIFMNENGTFVFISAAPDSLEYGLVVDGQAIASTALVSFYSIPSAFWVNRSGVPTRSLGLRAWNGSAVVTPTAQLWTGSAWEEFN